MNAYPHRPGHRGQDTSQAAAAGITQTAATVRDAVLATLHTAGARGATTHELADALPEYEVWTLQPRVSELVAQGAVTDSGTRRPSRRTGKRQRVYIPRPPDTYEQPDLFNHTPPPRRYD